MLRLVLTIETVRRKLRRSLHNRGWVNTFARAFVAPIQSALGVFRAFGADARRRRREELEFDRRFCVETGRDLDPGWMAAIASPNWVHGRGYEGAAIASVRNALLGLAIAYGDYTFIDYGSGKGRALFLAAELPFRRIVGVEYSPQLHEVALRNVVSYRNPSRQCHDVATLLGDAVAFEIPREPIVFFFHHPFDEPIFRQVVARMEDSYQAHPRHMIVIYYDAKCESLFEQSPIFRKKSELCAPNVPPLDRHVIYEAGHDRLD
jgi:hypothetical protein